MVVGYDEPLQRFGPWFYQRLLWECSVVGQVLYLEAEAAGLRGTGIGCYFDDAVHDLLDLEGQHRQVLQLQYLMSVQRTAFSFLSSLFGLQILNIRS